MCGIVGSIIHKNHVHEELYEALTILQHRGQDAAGITTSDGTRVYTRKDTGLVRDAIRQEHIVKCLGRMGLGHVRYPTSGTQSADESQPFYVNSPYGLSIVHNGNLTATEACRKQLVVDDLRHLNTQSDSEILLNVLAYEMQRTGRQPFSVDILWDAVSVLMRRVTGAYSAVVMINGKGLLAFRDANAIRPLCYGVRETSAGVDTMFASESIALDALGYKRVGDVLPGEAIFIDMQGKMSRHQCVPAESYSPCLFEFIYLARPDSVMDGISVHDARWNMGVALAKKIQQDPRCEEIDVVIPIPDTSRTTALPLANALGKRYSEGFVKNRYIARTFIMPGQEQRERSLRLKLNPIPQEFKDKTVLLVDDSIVRGTTSREIIRMARAAGAKKIYFASAAPPICYANVYGIDMPTRKELIAADQTLSNVASDLGADWLIYLPLDDVINAVHSAASGGGVLEVALPQAFEDSVFTGNYLTAEVDAAYLDRLQELRPQTRDD